MAKKRITEDQVKKILQEVANGAKPPVLAKKYGFSLGTFYNWKNKIGIPAPDGSAAPAPAAPAKKAAAKKPAAKKAPAKKAAKKVVAKKAPAKKAAKKVVAKKAPAKKVAAKKPVAKKAPVRKAAPKRASASAENKLQAEIAKRQKQIATIEGQITRLKVRYAEAILKSVK